MEKKEKVIDKKESVIDKKERIKDKNRISIGQCCARMPFDKFKKHLEKLGDKRKPETVYVKLGGKLPTK